MTEFLLTSPDGRKFKITGPEGATREQIENYVAKQGLPPALQAEQPSGFIDFFKSIPRGVVQGLAGMASAMGQSEANLMGMEGVPDPETGTKLIEQNITGRLPQPQTTAGKYGRTVGEFMGNPTTYLGPGGIVPKVVTGVTGALGSEAGGQLTEGTSAEPAGRIAGAVLGAKAPGAVAKTITPNPIPPQRQQYLNTLERENIPFTAGQATGKKSLQWAEGHLGEMPGAGGATERANEASAEAFNRWALSQAGATGNKADQATINRMWQGLYGRYNDILARNPQMIVDVRAGRELADALQNYEDHVPPSQQVKAVSKIIGDISDLVNRTRGVIPSDVYQDFRSRFARMERAAKSDPEKAEALGRITSALDDAMERTMVTNQSPDAGQFRELRQHYRNAIAIEKAAGTGAKADDIPPNKLRNALSVQDKRAYQRGTRDMAEVTQAADKILAPLPQSGTAPRAAMGTLASTLGATIGAGLGGPAAGIPAGVAAGLAPGLAGRVLLSPPVQGYLQNQIIPPSVQFPYAGTRALAAGGGSALEHEAGP